MTRPVLWSRDALDDLKKQLVYIAGTNPVAASRVVDRLRKAAAQLEDFATGRPGRVAGTYEKSVTGLPYVIAYEIVPRDTGEVVAILRVIHTARDWPEETWPSD
ncbi:plasmid stabilization protein [Polymorphobacter glacialis]|uniref:Plasmid stabilization protein n=1 Tax=Sandarakinorhabdus glacialis TaxID=1614636 RepID=A0A917A1S5_9SPHN|nr:type II toxin-antitoxin system RelE/ParE family toxin [Polymorphobacter glacialis]GGE22503.1 plasmid stabilization protein [Polymorphobacter glacialis]